MLLSRVAETLYWMVRYIERAEDMARMVMVNSELLLDLPKNVSPGWEPLLTITDTTEAFHDRYKEAGERNVVKFLVGDERNSGSVISSLSMAREDMRVTRSIVPREAWETINDLRTMAREHLNQGLTRRGRYAYLRAIVGHCQQITGILTGTMAHDLTYNFVRMGRNMERADMGVRILDVRAQSLLPRQAEELKQFNDIQWKSVLKSLASYQDYRRKVHVRVKGDAVLGYLLQNPQSPRAIMHTLGEVEDCLRNLPRNEDPLRALSRARRMVKEANVHELAREGLHEFLEELSAALADIHEVVARTYFQLEQPEAEPLAAA